MRSPQTSKCTVQNMSKISPSCFIVFWLQTLWGGASLFYFGTILIWVPFQLKAERNRSHKQWKVRSVVQWDNLDLRNRGPFQLKVTSSEKYEVWAPPTRSLAMCKSSWYAPDRDAPLASNLPKSFHFWSRLIWLSFQSRLTDSYGYVTHAKNVNICAISM